MPENSRYINKLLEEEVSQVLMLSTQKINLFESTVVWKLVGFLMSITRVSFFLLSMPLYYVIIIIKKLQKESGSINDREGNYVVVTSWLLILIAYVIFGLYDTKMALIMFSGHLLVVSTLLVIALIAKNIKKIIVLKIFKKVVSERNNQYSEVFKTLGFKDIYDENWSQYDISIEKMFYYFYSKLYPNREFLIFDKEEIKMSNHVLTSDLTEFIIDEKSYIFIPIEIKQIKEEDKQEIKNQILKMTYEYNTFSTELIHIVNFYKNYKLALERKDALLLICNKKDDFVKKKVKI